MKMVGECMFIWVNKVGYLIGVIIVYVLVKGKIWMIVIKECVWIKVIVCDGCLFIVIISKGIFMGGGKCVIYKGYIIIYEDEEIKYWMYNFFV